MNSVKYIVRNTQFNPSSSIHFQVLVSSIDVLLILILSNALKKKVLKWLHFCLNVGSIAPKNKCNSFA